jgi:SAM-dependent methyltransferase
VTCPFCRQPEVRFVFERGGRKFGHCRECRAYLWLDPSYPAQDLYEDEDFISRVEEKAGSSPDTYAFRVFSGYLVGHTLLEIGPGTGKFLAAAKAAGYEVTGVETSPAHRKYIREKWGIETLGEALEEVVPGRELFDNVVSINCVEHVVRPEEHFRAVHEVLRPGGRFIISTCNSQSLMALLTGRWWTMLKPPDHINLVSLASLKAIGGRVGLKPLLGWTHEHGSATPVTLAASIKDWAQSWRKPSQGRSDRVRQKQRSRLRMLAQVLDSSRICAPVGGAISLLGYGGNARIVFEKPALR